MFETLAAARNSYAYPAVGLTGNSHPISIADWSDHYRELRFTSTLALDEHHHRLLNSPDGADLLHGLFSTVYWGYFTSNGLASARCNWVAVGKSANRENSLKTKGATVAQQAINAAREALRKSQYGAALKAVCEIPYVGPSFGSKILAFIDLEHVGVLDNKIVEHLSKNTFDNLLSSATVDRLKQKASPASRFDAFCVALNEIKNELNARGFGWRDASGAALPRFRAVDVERALFAQAVNSPK